MNTAASSPLARLPLTVGACTHVGRRANNEDALLAAPELGLFVVADGMGGYEGGEIASRLVVDSLAEFFRRNAEDSDCTWPCGLNPDVSLDQNMLRVGLQLADLEVRLRRQGELRHMGATAVALVVRGSRVVLAHVGDSRIYRLRAGVLEQLTRDHSLVAMMEELEGRTIPKERAAQFAHVVTRAIGQSGNSAPDLCELRVERGDTFLLCSDGLSDPLPPETIAHLLATSPPVAAESLVTAAYEAGGSDNISALVLRVG
ncbi:MAG: protein phosphatase 2C domain-containing protein [Myxococcota bacterium]|nr:protein phosphatase 2C domain-containing protein [Myxococcota bacterium]